MPNTDSAQGVQIIERSGVATEFGGSKTFNIAVTLDALNLNTYLLVFCYLKDDADQAFSPDSIVYGSDTFTTLGDSNGFVIKRILNPTAGPSTIDIACTSPSGQASICYGHIAFRNVNQTTPEILATLNTASARNIDIPFSGALENMEAISIIVLDGFSTATQQTPLGLSFGQKRLVEVFNDPHNTSVLLSVSIGNINGVEGGVRNFHWTWLDFLSVIYVNLILDAEPFYHVAGTIHT